jgi:hypothetical protein
MEHLQREGFHSFDGTGPSKALPWIGSVSVKEQTLLCFFVATGRTSQNGRRPTTTKGGRL